MEFDLTSTQMRVELLPSFVSLNEPTAVLQALGNTRGEAQARCHLGVILYKQGHMEKARAEFDVLMTLAQQLSDRHILHIAMVNYAGTTYALERHLKEDIQDEH